MVALSVLVSGGCKKKKETDPCEGKTCLNGGICNDGTCACPTGFTGTDCGTQITPTKISIDSIRVTKFPALDGTSTWDGSTFENPKPDIYAVVKAVGSSTELMHTQFIDNVDAQPYMLAVFPKDFTDIVQQYTIELYDDDTTTGDDLMGSIDFSLYSSTGNASARYRRQVARVKRSSGCRLMQHYEMLY